MVGVRVHGEEIRTYILENVEKHPRDIARCTAEKFGITRQAVNKHLKRLLAEGALVESGRTRNRTYRPASLAQWTKSYPIVPGLDEGAVWFHDIKPHFEPLPANVIDIWHYGFTEMFNNAIEHSNGQSITVNIEKWAAAMRILVLDDGIGIFKKIQTALGLSDERHAVLELSKGKLTTDAKRHSGEGIFFTSRLFDDFGIFSGKVVFRHQFGEKRDWILEPDQWRQGTAVHLQLSNHSARTTREIFDAFTTGSDYGFNKTSVPVKLAREGDENLISRSQAKRLLARLELFQTIVFDFAGVEMIGQAFADEIFRVFAREHPRMELLAINADADVQKMISRAKAAARAD